MLAEVGVSDQAMTAEANQQAKLRRLLATEVLRREVEEQTLTTSEVADLLDLKGAGQVRNLLARGRICAIARPHRESLFPAWQFLDGQPLPHLGEMLAALPHELHPLDVEAFMTSAAQTLGGRSPAEWLGTGGSAAPVADLADQQGWV